ncbi:adhesion G protein-coupled receptor L2-like [Glandiceps talaboti]
MKESEELEDEGESSRSETSDSISSIDYGEDLHKTACEKENMEIVCDEDGVIEILMANYGRLDTQTCPRRRVTTVQDTNCRADSSYEVVADRCNGQSRCRVPVNNGIFQGDPCPGTVKYLEVTYRCDHGQANSSPIKFSTSATINRTTLNTTPRTPTMQVTSHGIYTSPTVQDIEKAPEKSTTKQTTTNRSGLHCQAVRNRDIDWPMTITGEITRVKCPDGLNGTAWWSCEGIPARWTPSTGPNLSQCKSPWVTAMYEKLQSIETIDDVIETTDILVSETDSKKKLYGGDVVRCLDIINQLPKMLPELLESLGREERLEFVTDTIQSITASGSNLLAIEHTNAWKDLQNELTQEATKLLTGMESNGFLLADELPEGRNTQASQNILMEVENFDQEKNSEVKFPRKNSKSTNDDWKMVSDSISLPYESVKARSDNGTAKLVFLIYNHIGQFLNGDSFDDNTTDNATRLVNTRVISASINSMHSPTKLAEPAIIVFQHENANRTNPACSFWNYTLDGEGEWSEYGCETVESNETHTVCACSHLTNFAVLVDVHGTKV